MLLCLLNIWLFGPEDELARKYGWEDVYNGKQPNAPHSAPWLRSAQTMCVGRNGHLNK